MNKLSIIVAAVVAVAVSLAVGYLIAPQPVSPDPLNPLGGLERNIRENLRTGVNTNAIGSFNGILTTASGSRTFTAPEICDHSTITLSGDTFASAQPQTFPSASSLIQNCLPNKGDYRDVEWVNLSKDEAPFLKAGSRIDMYIASSSVGSVVEIPANRSVWTRFTHIETGSISVKFQEYKHQ